MKYNKNKFNFFILFFFTANLIELSNTMTHAKDYFNPALVELGAPSLQSIDLSLFESTGSQLPGTYHVDIYINNEKVSTQNITFIYKDNETGKKKLLPCLKLSEMENWGILVNKHPQLKLKDQNCVNLNEIPQASSQFKFNEQQLLINIPQSSMKNSARGWIDEKYWDDGINSLILNYSISGSKNSNGINSQYINLRPGFNLGPWRFRNYTTWSNSNSNKFMNQPSRNWKTVYTNVNRGIKKPVNNRR